MAPLIFYVRSFVEQDWRCKRSRYHLTEAVTSQGRTGLVPTLHGLALDEGTILHEVMPRVLAPEAEDPLVFEIAVSDAMDWMRNEIPWPTEDKRLEQMTMVEGLMRGAYRIVRPRILREYEVLKIESELLYPHHDVVMSSKPDSVLRRKADRVLKYLEWKSTGILSPKWFDSWEVAPQLQWGCMAIERAMGEPCDSVLVQALYKGRMQDGELSSLLAYGYAPATRPTGSRLSYAYVKGLRKYPIWKEPGGIKRWVEECPTEILETYFPEARPISIRTALLDASLRQTAIREKEIAAARNMLDNVDRWEAKGALSKAECDADRQSVMDKVFPQEFSSCSPIVGFPCAYKELCFNPVAARDPERFGFSPRIPHHKNELLAREGTLKP